MEQFLQDINTQLNGNVVILGGWAKHYNGYAPDYSKHWVDVCITQSGVDSIIQLGLKGELTGGHTWGTYILDQFIVIAGTREARKVIDVFVSESLPPYSEINGLKILTPQGDIDWHQGAYDLLGGTQLENKVSEKRSLYGL